MSQQTVCQNVIMPVDGFTEGEKTLKEMENLKFFGIIFN